MQMCDNNALAEPEFWVAPHDVHFTVHQLQQIWTGLLCIQIISQKENPMESRHPKNRLNF